MIVILQIKVIAHKIDYKGMLMKLQNLFMVADPKGNNEDKRYRSTSCAVFIVLFFQIFIQ